MKYVYPAILYPDEGKISVSVPDLPGCHTFGEDKADALFMAKDAIEMWLWDAENKKEPIPAASETLPLEHGETLTLVAADTDEYRRTNDAKAVKKTLSIPAWLNAAALEKGVNFSQVLQSALMNEVGAK